MTTAYSLGVVCAVSRGTSSSSEQAQQDEDRAAATYGVALRGEVLEKTVQVLMEACMNDEL
jgi:hypothetical protein